MSIFNDRWQAYKYIDKLIIEANHKLILYIKITKENTVANDIGTTYRLCWMHY